MPFFRKRPVVIEAVQWTGDNIDAVFAFMGTSDGCPVQYGPINSLLILTLEGTMQAHVGDWIIKGLKGEFYPCKPDIFELTYELESPVEQVGTTDDGRAIVHVP